MLRPTPGRGTTGPEECSGSSSGGGDLMMYCNPGSVRRRQEAESSLLSWASEEDEEVVFDTSDTENNREVLMAGRHYPSIQEFASAIPNHLLLGSLLEHLCCVYENNPTRSHMLFKVIGQRLAAMNLLSPLAVSDEFSTIRLQHNRAFTELLNAASSSLYPQNQQCLGLNMNNSAVKGKEDLFQRQTSRYLSEFEEICRLGKGSYGNVYKVRNKLDGQNYAVKKILIKKVSKEDCMKVLREVKVLSSLHHVNVVGYHTAWMEHVQPAENSNFPALEPPEEQHSSTETRDDGSASSSIVFQSLSHTRDGASSFAREEQHAAESVPNPEGNEVCPKTMHRAPESYVPCVFLGQARPNIKSSQCPAVGFDGSAPLEQEQSGRSSSGLNNNNSCVEKERKTAADKCRRNPLREVQFQLMLYIQMQLCDRSLKDWISERNAWSKEERMPKCHYDCVDVEHTLSLLRHVLEGVAYIHSKGIMHRDLKPRNIFLEGPECHVRIGDFGLACQDMIADAHKRSNSPGSDSIHTSGVGTFVYASPEQLKGSHYDSKSDMYSIGVITLELFQPFGTEMERVRTLGDLREGKIPETLHQRWPLLSTYIAKLTSKEPSERPTAYELLQSDLFCSKDTVIHGLQRKVEEQEEEIMQLRMQISQLQSSRVTVTFSELDKT